MADYVRLAVDGGARIVGGCCGTSFGHLAAMRKALDSHTKAARPTIETIVEQGQWNALRHGHFAYYSLTALMYLLSTVGMRVATAWEFDLYGGRYWWQPCTARPYPTKRLSASSPQRKRWV